MKPQNQKPPLTTPEYFQSLKNVKGLQLGDYPYFALLGHITSLSMAEIYSMAPDAKVFENNLRETNNRDQICYLDTLIDAQKAGSIVFSGQILGKLSEKLEKAEFSEKLEELLEKGISGGALVGKKIGFVGLGEKYSKDLIQLGKKIGFKKITTVTSSLPNYGHLKQVATNWIVFFKHGDIFLVGVVKSSSDQEYWSILDQNLPVGEMKRGLINLKLARAMVNLASKNIIYDTMVGAGRLLVSGLDIKKHVCGSDIDVNCQSWSNQNIDWAKSFLENYRPNKENPDYKLAKQELFPAQNILQFLQTLNQNESIQEPFSIVTEGWLGKNFSSSVGLEAIQSEQNRVMDLWDQVFSLIYRNKNSYLKEIIFCLPFSPLHFQTKKFLETKMTIILDKYGYGPDKFNILNHRVLYYARKDSQIGHAIIRVRF